MCFGGCQHWLAGRTAAWKADRQAGRQPGCCGRHVEPACWPRSTESPPACRTHPAVFEIRRASLPSPSSFLQDLLLPEEGLGFVCLRCPLRDVEEEDLLPFLPGGRWLCTAGWMRVVLVVGWLGV